jgi:hypothetical protein
VTGDARVTASPVTGETKGSHRSKSSSSSTGISSGKKSSHNASSSSSDGESSSSSSNDGGISSSSSRGRRRKSLVDVRVGLSHHSLEVVFRIGMSPNMSPNELLSESNKLCRQEALRTALEKLEELRVEESSPGALPVSLLRDVHPALQSRVIRLWVRDWVQVTPSYEVVTSVVRLLDPRSGSPCKSGVVSLGRGMCVVREGEWLEIKKDV